MFDSGIFRIGELICKALAFSQVKSGGLKLHERFFDLNQSEKITVSYYLGQGLTKLYAEKLLGVKWLLHVDDYDHLIQYHKKGTASAKITVGTTKKVAERPDLVGIVSKNESHFFEAKGRSTGYDRNEMQHAINQVSQVKQYNGAIPKTAAACYFDLSSTPIKGYIIDPENDGFGIDFLLNEEEALYEYYSFFREGQSEFQDRFQYGNHTFYTTPVGVPNIHFGFDERLLKMSSADLLSNGLRYEELESNRQGDNQSTFSVGADGLILFDRSPSII